MFNIDLDLSNLKEFPLVTEVLSQKDYSRECLLILKYFECFNKVSMMSSKLWGNKFQILLSIMIWQVSYYQVNLVSLCCTCSSSSIYLINDGFHACIHWSYKAFVKSDNGVLSLDTIWRFIFPNDMLAFLAAGLQVIGHINAQGSLFCNRL